jgi:hypothetical protein
MVNSKEQTMQYAEFQKLDGNDQVDIFERVYDRITYIPGYNTENSDFESDDVNEHETFVQFNGQHRDANAQALRDYLTANNAPFVSRQTHTVIFRYTDLFDLFSDE